MNAKRFLVTGASGFIGACLTRALLTAGKEVHVLLRRDPKPWRLVDVLPQCHVHRADLLETGALEHVVDQARFSVVYHLATAGPASAYGDGEHALRTNLLGTWHLIHACIKSGCELFVNMGTSSEYGTKRSPMSEGDLLEPNSVYAVSKAAQTLLCQHLANYEGRPIVTLRPFSVYGPYEEPSRLIPRLLMAGMTDSTIDMAKPSLAHDFVYVGDLMRLLLDIDRLHAMTGKVVNIGTGTQVALSALVDAASEVCGREIKARWGAFSAREWDSDMWVADTSRFRQLFGNFQFTPLKRGLEQSRDWLREHRKRYTTHARSR